MIIQTDIMDREKKSRIKHNEKNIGVVEKAGKLCNMQAIYQLNLLTKKWGKHVF